MSWETIHKGKRKDVFVWLTADFDRFLSVYPAGTPEGDDLEAIAKRLFAALEAVDMSPHPSYEDNLIEVHASGSHAGPATDKLSFLVNGRFSLKRVLKTQQA